MNSTALGAGAEKAQEIIFISEAHEKFYYEKLKEVRYQDVYHKALCYCLGISDDTRRNANRIYDFKTGCVKTECLHEGWQTSGSVKVVRMAFNLYCNGTPSVDDYKDAEEQISECRQYTLNNIPGELIKLRDSDRTDSWINSFSSSEKTKLGDYQNLYSFITAFDITKDEAETALAPYINGGMMTSEQVDILFSGSEEAVTNEFASEYSVVVGENAYCPNWLYINTIDDYTAAGINAEAVKEKAPLYSDFAFSNEARKAFSEKLSEFIGEDVVIEPITSEEKDTETDVIFDAVEEDMPDDEAEEIIEE